jgi:hypothetical protein
VVVPAAPVVPSNNDGGVRPIGTLTNGVDDRSDPRRPQQHRLGEWCGFWHDGVMVATLVNEEFQVTEAVRSCAVLSEYAPTALNCSALPWVTEAFSGVKVMEFRVRSTSSFVTADPHPCNSTLTANRAAESAMVESQLRFVFRSLDIARQTMDRDNAGIRKP